MPSLASLASVRSPTSATPHRRTLHGAQPVAVAKNITDELHIVAKYS